jgi:diphthamide synthase (EF-2-diphthine--ammonia ligase)
MLSQIVRPMVRTQIRLLANSQATYSTLVTTIAQWLGFLGVQANVTQLRTAANRIQLSLTVGKPEACEASDWERILHNLDESDTDAATPGATALNPQQERKLQRLLAYVIQVGNPDGTVEWNAICPQLQTLGFDDVTLAGIRAALKVPQSFDQLMEGLDADVAAIALSKAVGITLLDRQVNSREDQALSALFEVMKRSGVEA